MDHPENHSEPVPIIKIVLFYIPAGIALGMLAMMVLVPLWAEAVRSEHYRDCQRLRIEESRRMVDAWGRLCESAKTDVVLNQRVAGGKLGLDSSRDEVDIVHDTRNQSIPGLPATIQLADPPMPYPRVLGLAERLKQKTFRNGAMAIMVTLAILATVAGLGRREDHDEQSHEWDDEDEQCDSDSDYDE